MTADVNKSEVAAAYDQWADTYDNDHNRTRDLAGKILRDAGLAVAGRSIVEIGCGTGRNTEWLARPDAGAADIVALDFSAEMLERARVRVTDGLVTFIQHDVQSRWPLANDSADVVIAMLILEHVEHLELIFAEAARVLRTAGELFVCELHPERQLLGAQAQFTSTKTGERMRVTAYLHRTEDYSNAGLLAGFELVKLWEWRDEDAPHNTPRLLSLHYRLPGP
jgi:malonyl-CoA O-methyltransferase